MTRKKKSVTKTKTPKRKTDFMTQLSHGFRNSLNAIIGFSELISSKKVGKINRTQKEYLNDIIKSAKELLGILPTTTVKDYKKKKVLRGTNYAGKTDSHYRRQSN